MKVDLSPLENASETYKRPNYSFQLGKFTHYDGLDAGNKASPGRASDWNYISLFISTLQSTIQSGATLDGSHLGPLTNVQFGDMTKGSVLFAGTSGFLSQNNSNLFWDNTNVRLGLGTTLPSVLLDVNGDIRDRNMTSGSVLFAGTSGVVSQNNASLFWDNVALGLQLGSTAFISFATNPATAGRIRLPNNGQIISRNFLNSLNIQIAVIDASNVLNLGDGGSSGLTILSGNYATLMSQAGAALTLNAGGTGTINFQISSVTQASMAGTGAFAINQWLNVGTATGATAQGDLAWSRRATMPLGSASILSLTFSGEVTGFFEDGLGVIGVVCNATKRFQLDNGTFTSYQLVTDGSNGLWFTDSLALGSNKELNLLRIGSGTLALQRSLSNQAVFRIYGNATNYLSLTHDGTNATIGANSGNVNFNTANVGINAPNARRRLDILDAANPQLRLTFTDNVVYVDHLLDSAGLYTLSNIIGLRVTGTSGSDGFHMNSPGNSNIFQESTSVGSANIRNWLITTDFTNFGDWAVFSSNARGGNPYVAGTQRFALTFAGNIICGNAVLATTATDGWIYLASSAGTPTGTPTAFTGRVPYNPDTTNYTLHHYIGAAWRAVAGNLGAASTPTQIIANQNDYNWTGGRPAATFQRISSDAARSITGISAVVDGTVIWISNVGSFTITLQNQNIGSLLANRIITGTGADLGVAADQTVALIYDGTTARWRVLKNA